MSFLNGIAELYGKYYGNKSGYGVDPYKLADSSANIYLKSLGSAADSLSDKEVADVYNNFGEMAKSGSLPGLAATQNPFAEAPSLLGDVGKGVNILGGLQNLYSNLWGDNKRATDLNYKIAKNNERRTETAYNSLMNHNAEVGNMRLKPSVPQEFGNFSNRGA